MPQSTGNFNKRFAGRTHIQRKLGHGNRHRLGLVPGTPPWPLGGEYGPGAWALRATWKELGGSWKGSGGARQKVVHLPRAPELMGCTLT